MTPILLTTLTATYQHCAFGLRYLFANLRELRPSARLIEFTIAQNPNDIAESILAHDPKIVGFGVYIWNTRQTYDVVSLLKRVRPELIVVLGGPEVSHETETQKICGLADFTIRGEADFLFYEFCRDFLAEGKLPGTRWISGPLPEVREIESPYALYSDEDIRHRILYVEASRGCPYKCEFCLSSIDKSVRGFDLDRLLADLDRLIERGARCFKFVDRTFNLSVATSLRILRFFLDRIERGLFIHFEMVPDRLPVELRELISRFPPGSLQFEIGIQTWNPDVARRISRRQDYAKVRDNFEFLVKDTGVHLHADLIVGLPGETLESFGEGFDAVAALQPHEIQVGLLKRLKGTPIIRHDAEWEMVYQEAPPFQVARTRTLDFSSVQKLARFSKFWDLYANSGNFPATMAVLRSLAAGGESPSVFRELWRFCEFLDRRHPQRHGIALVNLVESAWIYLLERGVDRETARTALVGDYTGRITRDIPRFLRRDGEPARPDPAGQAVTAMPARQRRHVHVQ